MSEPRTRRQTRRDSPEVQAEKALTVLHNPEVKAQFDKARAEFVRDIEHAVLDGTRAAEEKALEAVRMLQCLNKLQAVMLQPAVALKMKLEGRKRPLN